MTTVLIVVAVIVLLVAAGYLYANWRKKRLAERARLRERLGTEARGHDEQFEANAARAREMSERTDDLKSKAELEREEAEKLRIQAERRERSAAEIEAEAETVAVSSERARTAAARHDERAQDAKRQLEDL